ncbi:MAG: two-component system regulatory protein YycI [Tuberibacillus sp.]
MNWSKTKSIFIICFLLLDIFLGYQMFQRIRESQKQLHNYQLTSLSEVVKKNNIEMRAKEPSTDQKMYFLKGTFTNFNDDNDAKQALKGLQKIHPEISFTKSSNGQILNATFKNDKQKIKAPKTTTEMHAFLKEFVYKGEDYKHWPTSDGKDKVIHFIQMYNGNPLYSVSVDNGNLYMLDVYTDGDVVTGYQQILIKTEQKEPVKITMSAEEAIQKIAEDYLQVSDNAKVADIEIGYINLATDIKEDRELPYILAWYINVKTDHGDRAFFITMFGKIFEYDMGEKGSGAS